MHVCTRAAGVYMNILLLLLLHVAYLSCDGSVEGRTLFLTVSGSQRRIEEAESDADLNTARCVFVFPCVCRLV